PRSGQRLRRVAAGHAFDARRQRFGRGPQRYDLEAPGSGLVFERAIICDSTRLGGEGAYPHLAFETLGAPNLSNQHPVGLRREGCAAAGSPPSAAGSAGAAAAWPAALAFSAAAACFASSRSTRFLPG